MVMNRLGASPAGHLCRFVSRCSHSPRDGAFFVRVRPGTRVPGSTYPHLWHVSAAGGCGDVPEMRSQTLRRSERATTTAPPASAIPPPATHMRRRDAGGAAPSAAATSIVSLCTAPLDRPVVVTVYEPARVDRLELVAGGSERLVRLRGRLGHRRARAAGDMRGSMPSTYGRAGSAVCRPFGGRSDRDAAGVGFCGQGGIPNPI